MSTLSKSVLRSNAIVPSVGPNKYVCSICLVDAKSKDLNGHITKLSHVATLEQFNHTFENCGDETICKLCQCVVPWDLVKTHAKLHLIVPWYEPDDQYRMFYENHTLKFSTKYYCYLCDEIYHDWSTIYMHIGREKHQKIIKSIRQSVPMSGSKRFYIDLICGGFVPKIGGSVECRICNETDLGYHMTAGHASKGNHQENKKKFIQALEKRFEKENSSKPIVDFVKSDENNVSSSNDHRMICNFRLENEEVTTASGDRSISIDPKSAEKKLSVASDSEDWIEKVPELFHEYNSEYIVSSTSVLCDEARARNGEKKKRRKATQIMEDPDPYCLICCFTIPGHSAVQDHVTGRGHARSRIKYGCDNIVCIEANWYYCNLCDRTITGFENLYRHLIDNSHLRSITCNFENDDEEILQDEETIFDSMEIPRESQTKANNCIYIVRRNAKKSFCQICDESEYQIATKNIKEHITSEGHKQALLRYGCDNIIAEGNNYHCRCCNLELADLADVYLHVKDKRHTSSIIKVFDSESTRTRKRIRDTFDTQECFNQVCQPPSGMNLLSDYIVNQIPEYSFGNFPPFDQCSPTNLMTQTDFSGNSAQSSSGNNSFWAFPQYSEVSKNRPESYVERYTNQYAIGNNNGQRSNEFWPFPNAVQTQCQENNVLTNFGSSQTKTLDREKNSTRPEWNSMVTSMAGELSKFLELAEASQSNYMPIFKDRMYAGIQKISCDICSVTVEDMTQLHVHMASHFSEEFARPKRNRYDNFSGINHYPSNPRNSIEIIENPRQENIVCNNFVVDTSTFNGNHSADNVQILPTKAAMDSNTKKQNNFAQFPPEKIKKSQNQQQSPKRASAKKILEILDFDHDYIYELEEKSAEIAYGLRLSVTIDANKVYCLICRKIFECTLSDYYEHLCSIDHCEYLELMEQDFELFVNVKGQFSDLDLAQEYMEDISDDVVRCFVCNVEIVNSEQSIERHIFDDDHSQKCLKMQEQAKKNVEVLKPRFECDWYKVHNYWCVICSDTTESEVNFVKHLQSKGHKRMRKKKENRYKRLLFDFCAPCGLLWYGYRCTNFYHSDIPLHQWLTRDGHYLLPDLSKLTKMLLDDPEEFIDEKVKYLDEIYEVEHQKEQHLLGDLERAVKTKFPRTKAYCFGSRATGLAMPNSDVDVYLDCRNLYNGDDSSDELYFINSVSQCLNNHPQSWDVEEVLTGCRCPIIRAYHRATGLKCDISFKNGLSVENTKLIKLYCTVFPTCRKLILFLKQWLGHCELQASRAITNYALYWLVIFYLQKESILPSVATLTEMSRKSRMIAGWEVSVTNNFGYNERASNYSIKEFLMRFFKFYANFDFRYLVACPLLGEELTKREFLTPNDLPYVMRPYIYYLRNSGRKAIPFGIDAVMCIQDPFDLRHNLTQGVSKVYLNRFRTCCYKSMDYLSLPIN